MSDMLVPHPYQVLMKPNWVSLKIVEEIRAQPDPHASVPTPRIRDKSSIPERTSDHYVAIIIVGHGDQPLARLDHKREVVMQ
jgi:hypothetical protein